MRTAVVTGAGSGIGLELTRRLVREGWSVAALVRSPVLEDTASDDSVLAPALDSGRLRVYRGELSDQASRSAVVGELAAREPSVDVLFNNAGASTGSPQYSAQGRELHYEVNTLAPHVLTTGLLENLAAAGGRVVNTTSNTILALRRFDPATLAHPAGRFRRIIGPYAASKLALTLCSHALAPALRRRDVSILAVTPGTNATPLVRGPGMPATLRLLTMPLAKPPSHGAALLIGAATGSYTSGNLVLPWSSRTPPFARLADQTLEVVAEAVREEQSGSC